MEYGGIKIIAFDYLSLIKGGAGSRYERTSYVAENLKDIAKRTMADLVNYKKQQEEMRGEMTQFMSLTLMHKFLSVYDDLNRVANMDDISANVKEGVEAIEKKFNDIFKSEGLEKLSDD